MSVLAVASSRILTNITNMDVDQVNEGSEKTASGVVVDETTRLIPAPLHCVGEKEHHRLEENLRTKSCSENGEKSSKFESSGGGESGGGGTQKENGGSDSVTKKRKTRRGKAKKRRPYPYAQQQPSTYHQRMRCRMRNRPKKPRAPYNTNEFLIADHNDMPDLEQKLAGVETSDDKPMTMRTRDSSFSIDSGEDFYSTPEDEEDYLTKEFSNEYEEFHAERLAKLTKFELLQEYKQLEAKLDVLTKRSKNRREVDEKIKSFQQKIEELQQANDKLRRENEALRKERCGRDSPVSSVDSESDSDSSRNGNRSICCDCPNCSSDSSLSIECTNISVSEVNVNSHDICDCDPPPP